jgi:maltose alpha-D-glucosyltransferase/alpha-amylase
VFVTAAHLDRFVEEQNLLHDGEGEEQAPHLRHLAQIGRRLAELHMALATDATGPAFTPEPVPATELKRWSREIVASAEAALDILKARRDVVREINRPLLDHLLAQRAALPNILESLLPDDGAVTGIRHHGNFHLEQVLIVKDDVFITDFNGEPRRDAGRTAAQGACRPGRRRHDPFHRLRGCRSAGAGPQGDARRAGQTGRGTGEMARAFGRDLPRRLSRNHLRSPAVARRPWAAQRLIDFFLLEKGFHELEYEAAHEVDRLRFPLASILRILSRQPNVNE